MESANLHTSFVGKPRKTRKKSNNASSNNASSNNALAEADEPSPPVTTNEVAGLFIRELFGFLTKTSQTLFDRWTFLGALLITVGGLVALTLGGEGNADALIKLVELLVDFAGSSLVSFGGWVTAAFLLLVGMPTVRYQHKRIKAQGDTISQLKGEKDPERLSSNNPTDLTEYALMGESQLLNKMQIVPRPKDDEV